MKRGARMEQHEIILAQRLLTATSGSLIHCSTLPHILSSCNHAITLRRTEPRKVSLIWQQLQQQGLCKAMCMETLSYKYKERDHISSESLSPKKAWETHNCNSCCGVQDHEATECAVSSKGDLSLATPTTYAPRPEGFSMLSTNNYHNQQRYPISHYGSSRIC